MAIEIKRIKLRGLSNFRDLGGMPAYGKKTIRHGLIFRSGKMYRLPSSTIKRLNELKIGTIIDLRLKEEAEEKPCVDLDGAKYLNMPLLSSKALGVTIDKNVFHSIKEQGYKIIEEYDSPIEYMTELYEGILFEKNSQKSLSTIIRILVETDKGVLINCTEGKDRTGIVSMLIETLLGVDEETVLLDYTATGKFKKKRNSALKVVAFFAPFKWKLKKMLLGFLDTFPILMENVISELNKRYGSVIDYTKKELSVTDEDIRILREKYLE